MRVSELVETMPDIITFVKNLTPAVTQMVKSVEERLGDLTHVIHQDLLKMHTTNIKTALPRLIPSMKAFVSSLEKGKNLIPLDHLKGQMPDSVRNPRFD